QRSVSVPQVEQSGERLRGESRLGAVSNVAVEPRVRDVRLRQRVRQLHRLAVVPVEVGFDVPRETRALYRRPTDDELETMILGLRAVQVEQDEARRIALADVLNDLVPRLAAIVRRVHAETVLEEAQLCPDLPLLLELR